MPKPAEPISFRKILQENKKNRRAPHQRMVLR